MVDIRTLLPRCERDLPEWEVSRDGVVIGWVRQKRIGRAASVFYEAIGVNPISGERVNLEVSADFDERVQKIMQLRDNPEATRGIHWM